MIQTLDQRTETGVLAERLDRPVIFEGDLVLEAMIDRLTVSSSTNLSLDFVTNNGQGDIARR